MDEVNINKYLSQFNPILIVPVLSAVVGAILVFVFGFKRPNEPRFQSNSATDPLKKPKRKVNITKSLDNTVSSAKVGIGKKTTDAAVTVTSKKGSVSEKSSNNNNNVSSNNNNNINKKKTEEKKAENGSPSKKTVNKKTSKEPANAISKKSKINKNNLSEKYDEKPADFDDGGWFTVQSKSAKQKIKIDDSTGNQNENQSPKVQSTKNNKSSKSAKVEVKQSVSQVTSNELISNMEVLVPEHSNTEKKFNAEDVATPAIDEPTPAVALESEVTVQADPANAFVSVDNTVKLNTIEGAIIFDELGEWTDAKPDRKRGNKKKSRKD